MPTDGDTVTISMDRCRVEFRVPKEDRDHIPGYMTRVYRQDGSEIEFAQDMVLRFPIGGLATAEVQVVQGRRDEKGALIFEREEKNPSKLKVLTEVLLIEQISILKE